MSKNSQHGHWRRQQHHRTYTRSGDKNRLKFVALVAEWYHMIVEWYYNKRMNFYENHIPLPATHGRSHIPFPLVGASSAHSRRQSEELRSGSSITDHIPLLHSSGFFTITVAPSGDKSRRLNNRRSLTTMANPNRWVKLFNVAGAANRFRVNGEERARNAQRLAMMAALAYRPQEAQTRAWEAQIPADVDAPMHQVNDALAQMRPRDALTRGQQERDIWPALFPGGPFNQFD